MNRLLIALISSCLVVASIAAEPPTKNDNASISEIEARLASSGPSPQIYYNLAVAQEDAGNIVDAAINYQRALILDPGLRVAQNRYSAFAAQHNIGMRPRSWQDDVVSFVHPETLLIAGMVLGWIGALWLGWMIFSGPQSRWHFAIAISALLIGSAFFSMGYVSDPRIADANLAVISAGAEVKVLSGPAENSATVLSLNPGSAVGVISPRGSWTYVTTSTGANGWLASDRLIPVIPNSDSESLPSGAP